MLHVRTKQKKKLLGQFSSLEPEILVATVLTKENSAVWSVSPVSDQILWSSARLTPPSEGAEEVMVALAPAAVPWWQHSKAPKAS